MASAMPAISVRASAVSTGPSTGAVMRLKRNEAPQIAASATRRAVSAGLIGNGWLGFLFQREQLLLPAQAPGVAAQAAVGADRAVARDDQRHRIGAAGAAARAHRPRRADRARDFPIGARLAARDAAQLVPHPPLEHCAANVERQAREARFAFDERQDRST